MTCQNLQNKLLNITVLFIWYLLQIVGEFNQIILFALILKVITSICNETIFHLIVKSTLAKLCGVGIVYLFILLPEMKLASLTKMSFAKHGKLYFILASTYFSPLAILASV
jgi:multisubunit Na+/H+ antiporter MnhE subunit